LIQGEPLTVHLPTPSSANASPTPWRKRALSYLSAPPNSRPTTRSW